MGRIIAKEDHLSICFDGSDSGSKNRIINISANTSKGAFYIKNLDADAETMATSRNAMPSQQTLAAHSGALGIN